MHNVLVHHSLLYLVSSLYFSVIVSIPVSQYERRKLGSNMVERWK